MEPIILGNYEAVWNVKPPPKCARPYRNTSAQRISHLKRRARSIGRLAAMAEEYVRAKAEAKA